MAESVIDTCVHQWTTDPGKMADYVPDRYKRRLKIKSKIQDPVSGTIIPTLPRYHAYWNEDSPDHDSPSDKYTNSAQYRSPKKMAKYLEQENVETALLTGHELKFLPALPSPEYAAALASAYNSILKEEWLAESNRFKGSILVAPEQPEAAAEEIRKYASDPDMVSVLIYSGGRFPLGFEYLNPVWEASAEANMPVMIHTSGNPRYRQSSMGVEEHYVTRDTNLWQNHMANIISLVYEGVLDRHPELDIIWAGEGASWILHALWRTTRYWRNQEGTIGTSPPQLRQEPIEYLDTNFYLSTYPLGATDSGITMEMFDMVGTENILFGSGYPHWDHDTSDSLQDLSEEDKQMILRENAKTALHI